MPDRRPPESREETARPESALERLVEVEERIERETAKAREAADALVAEARERAREILEKVEAEVSGIEAEVRERLEARTRPQLKAIEEDVARREGAWRNVGGERARELARHVVREVVRRQVDESPGPGG